MVTEEERPPANVPQDGNKTRIRDVLSHIIKSNCIEKCAQESKKNANLVRLQRGNARCKCSPQDGNKTRIRDVLPHIIKSNCIEKCAQESKKNANLVRCIAGDLNDARFFLSFYLKVV
ncbi:hypothetical protein CDAR_556201 [Caerostris darwini]|uniref:Uncharacterized protein n=1 Tax=Caerostris darwini TaxID=1538125 RepID=A0AAV4STR1_9ARAC|nr:hypothetical protein CDAR_436491 [Caerostris darwini]GIY36296.1 hypothetical protein CDAR_556201 [Caerostris darwini]